MPFREEMAKRHLKVTGDLGRVVFMVCRMGLQGQINGLRALYRNGTCGIHHRSKKASGIRTLSTTWSDGIILQSELATASVGSSFDGIRNFDFEDVHIESAERIAEAVAKYDIDRFVHVSSYNADKNSPSAFFRTKGQAEEVVRSIFPETTLVRPAPAFGFEDKLLHKLAGVTNMFTSNHMRERFWPVHVSNHTRQVVDTKLIESLGN